MENEENEMTAAQTAAQETEIPAEETAAAELNEQAEETAAESKDEAEERKPREYLEVTDQMLDDTSRRLGVMLDYLCLEASVRAEKRNSRINLIVKSPDAGRIIGRKGQSLESLQLLLNRMMQKENINYPKICIDIGGYPPKEGEERRRTPRGDHEDRPRGPRRFERRERPPRAQKSFESAESSKEENLRQHALDTAKEVRRWGEPVTLPPMNSHDRRIIHVTLENEPDLATESVGEGAMKSVIVSLKKQD